MEKKRRGETEISENILPTIAFIATQCKANTIQLNANEWISVKNLQKQNKSWWWRAEKKAEERKREEERALQESSVSIWKLSTKGVQVNFSKRGMNRAFFGKNAVPSLRLKFNSSGKNSEQKPLHLERDWENYWKNPSENILAVNGALNFLLQSHYKQTCWWGDERNSSTNILPST